MVCSAVFGIFLFYIGTLIYSLVTGISPEIFSGSSNASIGLSLFSVPIITFFLPPTTSMILLCVPVLITNIIQMKIYQGISSFRFLPMFIALIIGILIGCNLVLKIKLSIISLILFTEKKLQKIVEILKNIKKVILLQLVNILTKILY